MVPRFPRLRRAVRFAISPTLLSLIALCAPTVTKEPQVDKPLFKVGEYRLSGDTCFETPTNCEELGAAIKSDAVVDTIAYKQERLGEAFGAFPEVQKVRKVALKPCTLVSKVEDKDTSSSVSEETAVTGAGVTPGAREAAVGQQVVGLVVIVLAPIIVLGEILILCAVVRKKSKGKITPVTLT